MIWRSHSSYNRIHCLTVTWLSMHSVGPVSMHILESQFELGWHHVSVGFGGPGGGKKPPVFLFWQLKWNKHKTQHRSNTFVDSAVEREDPWLTVISNIRRSNSFQFGIHCLKTRLSADPNEITSQYDSNQMIFFERTQTSSLHPSPSIQNVPDRP